MTHTVWVRSCLLLFGLWELRAAVVLPEGPGKAETQKLCSRCHSMEQTVSLRQGRRVGDADAGCWFEQRWTGAGECAQACTTRFMWLIIRSID